MIMDRVIALRTGKRTLTSTVRGIGKGAKRGVVAGKDILTK
jgi:hypothetical protein